MFRPTHFLILFAVFLCAYAAPASPVPDPAVDPIRPIRKQPIPGPEGESEPGKSDLDTDATVYLRAGYGYYGPRYGYYGPGLVPRTYGWGFRKSIGFGPYSVWY